MVFKSSQSDLATKTDIDHLRAEVKADIENLRTEVKADIENLRVEVKGDVRWLKWSIAAMIAVMLGGFSIVISSSP